MSQVDSSNLLSSMRDKLESPSTRSLRRRVSELEDEVQECRAVNIRVAELADIVTALLVPLAEGDKETARALLKRYHESL